MKKRFKKVYIEITNICNLHCRFCPPTRRTKEFMSSSNFSEVISKVNGYTNLVYLHLRGEPLIHPELKGILDACSKNNIMVNLTTNATLINDKKDIINNHSSLRQINYSLHSLEENDITDIKQYMDSIMMFIETNKNIIHSLRFWNLQNGVTKNTLVISYLKDKFGINDSDLQKPSLKIRENLYLNQEHEFSWPDVNNDINLPNGFCYGLRDQIGILVNGDVVPCCLDANGEMVLGNIFTSNLDSIISSSRATSILNGFSNRHALEDLCIHCEYKQRF